MLYQTDPRLNPHDQDWFHYGCRASLPLFWYEQQSGSTLTPEQIIALRLLASNTPLKRDPSKMILGEQFFVNSATELFQLVGGKGYYRNDCPNGVGGNPGWFPPDYVPLSNEREDLCLYNPFSEKLDSSGKHILGSGFIHFVGGNGKIVLPPDPWQGEIFWDPISGGSITARRGHIVSKRILVLET